MLVVFRPQPRIRGIKRKSVSSAFIDRLEEAVEREMKRFHVSRSFVIATAVAYALGVHEQANYRLPKRRKSSRRIAA